MEYMYNENGVGQFEAEFSENIPVNPVWSITRKDSGNSAIYEIINLIWIELLFTAGVLFIATTALAIFGYFKDEPYLLFPHVLECALLAFVYLVILLFISFVYAFAYDFWTQIAFLFSEPFYEPPRKNTSLVGEVQDNSAENSTSQEDSRFLWNVFFVAISLLISLVVLQIYFLVVEYSYFRFLLNNRITIMPRHPVVEVLPKPSEGLSTGPVEYSNPQMLSWHPVPSFPMPTLDSPYASYQ